MMTAHENVTATHLRDLFHTPIIEMRPAQTELVNTQLRMHSENMAIQTQLLQRLAMPHEADPLQNLREKYSQFPQFTGRTEHFLAWITEFQMLKEQRNLRDAVAIQLAKMAMG